MYKISTVNLAFENLTSVSALVFALGFLAARIKSDIRIPDSSYQLISIFLLFGIGLKGGVAMRQSNWADAILPILVTILVGALIPLLAFLALRLIRKLADVDRGSVAAHYGSTSLVTFTAALVFLESSGVFYEPFAVALLTVMEIPGLIVGIFLGSRALSTAPSWLHTMREILLGKTVLLLVGGMIVGAISGPAGFAKVVPFFVDLQPGILALFLLHLGFVAGSQFESIKATGLPLAVFGVAFPVAAGCLGVVAGDLSGLSTGGSFVLGVLSASASYIAAPAAVSIALPKANLSLAVTSSLAVTFPFNLTLGMPIFFGFANFLA